MRKLALFTAGFSAAAAVYVYLFREVRALWIAGACLLVSPVCLKLGLRRISAILLGLCAGLVWCFGYQQIHLAPADRLCGREQVLTVTLTQDPVETTFGCRAMVEISVDGISYDAVLYGKEDLQKADAGDRVTGTMKVEAAGLDISDGESLYHRSLGAMLILFAQDELAVEDVQPVWYVRLRQWLQDRIDVLYTGDTAGLICAILTGDRSGLPYAVENDLSVAGMSHTIAVSGMHVSILLAMLAFCLGGDLRLTAIIGLPAILAFTLMTGASPSACRAAVMQSMMLAAPLIHRRNDPVTTLGAAVLLLLLQNPWSIASVSLQLSAASVGGLLLFSGPIQRRILSLRKKPEPVLRFAASGLSASLSATLAALPLTVFYFEKISIAAVLSNLFLLWAVTAVFTLGLLSCFLGGAGVVLAVPVHWLSSLILTGCRWIASFPYAAAYPQNLPLMIWAVLAYGLVFWLLFAKQLRPLPVLAVMSTLFLCCILWGRYRFLAGNPVIRVLDVGQGQSVLWEAGGFTAVIDCGGQYPHEAGELAARSLHSGGQTSVDAVIVTHYDSDHAGGVLQLLDRVDAGIVLLPDIPDESGLRQAIETAAETQGCPVVPVSDLTELEFSGGKLTVYPPVFRENDTNSGICVLASAAEYDMLITGDLDRFLEMRLLSRWDLPQVELLVAGHHGAWDSTCQALLDRVKPQVAAISVGTDNSYGHPAQETLDRLAAAGTAVYRTDLDGTIVFRNQ